MNHTMRSAWKRWQALHNELSSVARRVRIPHGFRHYIRNNFEWQYILYNEDDDIYCNRCELDYNARRRYKGHYVFDISDEELLELERPEWIK